MIKEKDNEMEELKQYAIGAAWGRFKEEVIICACYNIPEEQLIKYVRETYKKKTLQREE